MMRPAFTIFPLLLSCMGICAPAAAQSCLDGDPELKGIRPEPSGGATLVFEADVEPKSRGRTIFGSSQIWFFSRDSYGQPNQNSDTSSFSSRIRADEDRVLIYVKYSGIFGPMLRYEDASFLNIQCY
jgi:hypothetical protein